MEMTIFTTYFSRIRRLPEGCVPVAICGGVPTWWGSRPRFRALAPKRSFFEEWRRTHDNGLYVRHFDSEVLGRLEQGDVVRSIRALAGSDSVALVCYEVCGAFCHRHYVADWLRAGGFDAREFLIEGDKPWVVSPTWAERREVAP